MNANLMLDVQRVVGSNIVMAQAHDTGKEYVLIGKGLGFSFKGEQSIQADDPRIEKHFRLEDREEWGQIQELMNHSEPKVVEIADQIIRMIAEQFPGPLNDKIYLALPSHIQFTIYRIRNGMEIMNPFLLETKMSFPKEFAIASKAAEMISEAFNVTVPEDEAGFLTYHVYASVNHVPVGQLVKVSNVISKLQGMIERESGIRFEQGSLSQARLMIHLRFSMERLLQQPLKAPSFARYVQMEYPAEYELALQLSTVMQENLEVDIPEEEIGFLAMHLYRLFQTHPNHINRKGE